MAVATLTSRTFLVTGATSGMRRERGADGTGCEAVRGD